MRSSILQLLILIFLVLSRALAENPVSIDEFKLMQPVDREKVIEQAPEEQKDELKKIHLHLNLLARWRGEEGLKIAKETQAAKQRGFGNLLMLFAVHSQVWDNYVGAIIAANEKAGMARAQQIAAAEELFSEKESVTKRLPSIHLLILNMAASPEAVALDKQAGQLAEQWSLRMLANGSHPYRPITKTERMEMDQQAGQILEEIMKLPKLSSEEVQKEVDAITDDKVRSHGFIRPLYLPRLPSGQSTPPFSSGQSGESER